jgi:hypothetical protein
MAKIRAALIGFAVLFASPMKGTEMGASANLELANRREGRARHIRCSRPIFAAFLIVFAAAIGPGVQAPASAASTVSFKQYDVIIGPAKRQTVLTGFLLGGAVADLAVLRIGEEKGRLLRIYALDAAVWTLKLETTLAPQVLFVDVANIGGRDRLITYEPGGLNCFDAETASQKTLVTVNANFKAPRPGDIPHVNITRDLNGDERDDLVVPDVDGFWVFVQMPDGSFADAVKIGPPTDMSGIYGADGYRYDPWSQSRVHEIDFDPDGRSDLVF